MVTLPLPTPPGAIITISSRYDDNYHKHFFWQTAGENSVAKIYYVVVLLSSNIIVS